MVNEIPIQSCLTVKDVEEATDEELNCAAVRGETATTVRQNSNRNQDGSTTLRRVLEPNPIEERGEMLEPRIAPPPRQVQQRQNDRQGAASDHNLLHDLESRKSGQALGHDNGDVDVDNGDVPGTDLKRDPMKHDDKSVGEVNAIAKEGNEGKKRSLDGTRGACQGGGRNSQRFEEIHECNCGHKGPIASHLRVNQQCVHGIRYELSLGEEISDESLIIQTTLVLQGCPAVGCAGGNHEQIPEVCISWWKESGWNVMEWEEPGEDLTSSLIMQKCKEFVRDLVQQQQNDDGRQGMSETASDNNVNADDTIQRKGNMEETTMAQLDDIFSPPITSTQVHTRNGRREGGERPSVNVSKPWDFN